MYEGYGPEGVAVLVEALTDNRNRTASEVRHLFPKHGGNLGASGAVVALSKINANDTLSVLGFHYTFLDPAWGIYLVLGSAIVLTGCAQGTNPS